MKTYIGHAGFGYRLGVASAAGTGIDEVLLQDSQSLKLCRLRLFENGVYEIDEYQYDKQCWMTIETGEYDSERFQVSATGYAIVLWQKRAAPGAWSPHDRYLWVDKQNPSLYIMADADTETGKPAEEDQSAYESLCPKCKDIVDGRERVNGMYCPHCNYNISDDPEHLHSNFKD